ncbi:hypothetical protein ACRRTK_002028 [Alexandromys fortis]
MEDEASSLSGTIAFSKLVAGVCCCIEHSLYTSVSARRAKDCLNRYSTPPGWGLLPPHENVDGIAQLF